MIEYNNFQKSLKNLETQFENYKTLNDNLPKIIQEAVAESVIQRFEICWDCLWKLLKRHLQEEIGLPTAPNGPNPVLRLANENQLLPGSVEQWLRYGKLCVATAHDYSSKKANDALNIMGDFIGDAIRLYQGLSGKNWGIMGTAPDNIDLTASQREEVAVLLKRHLPDTEVWAYGSRAKFTAKPHSDLDMVAFAAKEQSQAVANLREAFEESYLPFRVDLFVWDEIAEEFHRNIEKERVVLQERKGDDKLPKGRQDTARW